MSMVEQSDGRFNVSRRVYADPDVQRRELDRIFRTSWLFVAHESELPEPGDYVRRQLGTDPVIVTRDENGTVRVLANTCRHRGVLLCRADRGNSSHFRCPYHGWSYANTGELVGVTNVAEVYGRDFDKSRYPLYQPAHVDTAAGLVFACWDSEAPPLREALGDALWYLESAVGKWDAGMEVVGPPTRSIVRANWKAEAENIGGDGYHTPITHQSAFVLGMFAGPDDWAAMAPVTSKTYIGRVVDCGNGHTFRVHHLPVTPEEPSFFGYPKEQWSEMRRHLDAGQTDVQSRLSILHGNIFPNLGLIENFKTSTDGQGGACRYVVLRQQIPIAPDRNEMLWWLLAPRASDAKWRRESRHALLRTSGPAGLFQVDDQENFVGLSDAHTGTNVPSERIVYDGGVASAIADDLGWRGTVYDIDKSEQTMRAFYRRWSELVEQGELAESAA